MTQAAKGDGARGVLAEGLAFLRRQDRDWKVTVLRTSLDKLAYQMVFPYLSIYIVALGAAGVQLGMVNSLGMVVAGLLGPFTGWFIDRIGPKRIYLIGIGLLAVSYLTYLLAGSWEVTILAMAAYWIGGSTSGHSCATICGNCLPNRDRATGMLICETVAAGILGMVGPLAATWIVALGGGVRVGAIRPLFLIGLALTLFTFLIVLTQLSERRWVTAKSGRPRLFQDMAALFRQKGELKRWLLIAAVGQLPLGMIFPFTQVFAHRIKGADEFILGAMVTGSALCSIVLAVPLGRLADRIGRKRVLYMTIPLFWLSNIILVTAPSRLWLVAAGTLQGFFYIGASVSAAVERELVPPSRMGRWLGINRMAKMLLTAALALTAGMLWDVIGPRSVFLLFLALDALIRLPLLVSLPETLHGPAYAGDDGGEP